MELVSNVDGMSSGLGICGGIGTERRKRARTRLHLPVLMFRAGTGANSEAVQSVTRNLSSGGFYFLTGAEFEVGEELFCTIRIPTHDPQGKHLERSLQCRVRVVRVMPRESGDGFGVACRIEDYQLCQADSPNR